MGANSNSRTIIERLSNNRAPYIGINRPESRGQTGVFCTATMRLKSAFLECSTVPRVVGIDHLVLSVGDFVRSKNFYAKVLGFLGFKLKYEYPDMAGWSNGRTLFWIGAADDKGRKRKYRKG